MEQEEELEVEEELEEEEESETPTSTWKSYRIGMGELPWMAMILFMPIPIAYRQMVIFS